MLIQADIDETPSQQYAFFGWFFVDKREDIGTGCWEVYRWDCVEQMATCVSEWKSFESACCDAFMRAFRLGQQHPPEPEPGAVLPAGMIGIRTPSVA